MKTEFIPYPKTPRLIRPIVVTEKIDGTNGQVIVTQDGEVLAGSRNRLLTPESDNFGFCNWVNERVEYFQLMGPGRYYGEFWGKGIQRGYGLDHRRFSLFRDHNFTPEMLDELELNGIYLVPELYSGDFDIKEIGECLFQLGDLGSVASPDFMNPEGVNVYHTAAKQNFKVLLYNDSQRKGEYGE